MYKLGYWLFTLFLAAVTVVAFRFMAINGWTVKGMIGLAVTLVSFAVLLAFALTMHDRDRRSPPIAR